MKKILLLILLISTYANSQNSHLFLKDGSKISVLDWWGCFSTFRGGKFHYKESKDDGKMFKVKVASLDKVEKVETINGVTYTPQLLEDKMFRGLYKTLITGKHKSLICRFGTWGDFDEHTSVYYAIVDANNKAIVLKNFFTYGNKDKQKIMFETIKMHFPDCPEVLQSVEDYKNVEAVHNINTGGEPIGFMFQNKVFICE